jgi:NAD(P)-dependent dehydrogenase (short-subunit alcohol dehydrogenase family)
MLSDKVCIVAGGGNGLGRATAVELANAGATVVVNDLGTSVSGEGSDRTPAEETVERIRENGGTGMVHYGDISSFDYTEELVDDVLDEYGAIHGVTNFAGILRDGISYKMTPEQWDEVIRVHLRGHFALLRNVAAHWRETAGDDGFDEQRSFLCVSSDAVFGNVGQANYSSAKAGVLGLTRTTARELERLNVRVNALIPRGFTRMTERIPEEKRPNTREEIPPEKVSPMAAYLLSDEAEDVTGWTFWAMGDCIGLVSDPDIERVAFNEGGWTPEAIAERFHDTLGKDVELTKTHDALW